ncbi:MAG: MFS transporter, partial [Pseudomonadota bacterium]
MKALHRNERAQLRRFCLYGFLKNQLYFEPFLILALREKGFSFTAIGALIAFRAVSVNLLEIPSGAAADAWGRRRSMIASMAGYIVSFVVFALATDYRFFFPAMFAFAVGEAFRTGTHKAMIFDWLGRRGRQDEKTRVYGLTRSWSKIGSSVNAIIAAAIVIIAQSYVWVFWFSIIPYALNIVNFMFYPGYLDAGPAGGAAGSRRRRPFQAAWAILRQGLAACAGRKQLRGLILENVCFEGFYSTAKDYLQPLLKAAALAAPILLSQTDRVRTAVLVGIVYAALNLLSSVASRRSHRAAAWAGGESRLTGRIWLLSLAVYGAAAAGIAAGTSIA